MALIICLALLSAFGSAVAQDGVLGVGGFISPSPQLAETRSAAGLSRPDLSAVTVELRTTSGVKLHTSDCAPNGYYFIPVSEPGSYKLQVASPQGWTFAPAEAVVLCGKEDCAENKDVNFVFTGFQLQGNILGAGKADSCGLKSEAPSGVRVTITSDNDPKTTQTVESKSGHFTFANLFPGTYKISAYHPDFDIAPKQLSAEVGYDALTLTETFSITGYKLTGLVTSTSGAVSGVQVLLYSTEALELGCKSVNTGPALSGKHLLCSAITDSQGKYEFNGVHCARYTLLPLHTDTEAKFEIQPSSQDVVVQQGHLNVQQAFRVTGFAVSGRVVAPSGSGLAGVEVLLNGKSIGLTDSSGVYKASSLEAGTYTITAQAKDYDFAPLKDVAITPGLKQLPDITIERVSASGSVSFTDPSFAARPRVLTLSSDDGSYNQKISTTNGAFSVKLPPGHYRLAPVVLPEEKARGLVLSPAYRDVTLAEAPVSNLQFTQARFAIHGSVKCLDGPCHGKLRLRVVADNYDEQMLLEEVREGGASEDGTVAFKLDEMVPLGRYSISVLEPAYCWEQEAVQVSLTGQDETAPTLVQKGFNVKVSISHPGTLKATSASGHTSSYELTTGSPQSVCLPGSGIFSLAVESTCFFFGKEPVQYDTAEPSASVVEFIAGQALVQGELHSVGAQVAEVSLELKNKATGAKIKTQATADPSKPGVFRYQFFADLEAEIQLEPQVAGALSYPKRQTVEVLAQSCTPPVPAFSLKRGLFLEGAVQPAVEGVSVTVKYQGQSAAGEVGELGQEQGTYLTDADGKFTVGPLYDDVEYDVSVEKTGYRFHAVSKPPAEGGYIFSGEKLASVTVHVDLASALDKGLVLLSFSGDRGFRQNAKLGKDGTHTFYDMLPGTYYLRPQLREYQFEPAVAEVVVEEGGEHVVQFGSKRTAFSIMGTTRTVNGQVLGGVVVEAKSDGVVRESCISAEDGSYRIQGLIPGQAYSVSVRPTSNILKGFPAQQAVVMDAADTLGVDFSTFPSAAQLVITGVVDIADSLLSNAWVQVFRADTQQRVASVALDASRYYQVKVPQAGQYTLRVVASLPDDAYTSTEASVQVTTEPVQAGVLSLTQVNRPRADMEVVTTSLAMPIVAAALIVGLAVWKKDFLAEVFQVGPALSKPGGESNDAEWLSTSTLGKRRTASGSFAAAALTATTPAATPVTDSSTTTTTTHRRASRIT